MTNISGTSHEYLSTLYCCQLHKLATKALLFDAPYFILLRMTCSSTIHTERIVVFPTQQWLSDRNTTLHYTYTALSCFISLPYNKLLHHRIINPCHYHTNGLSNDAFNNAVYRMVVNSELERQIRNGNGSI